ncbi:hypothetical protein ARMSODRAFT_916747, partial [Armillaria solidipes]
MLRVAKSLNVRLDMQTPSRDVRRQIPLWHHVGFKKTTIQKRYGSRAVKCLMEKHEVETAGEAADVTLRLGSATHKGRRNCACDPCRQDRLQRDCENPHECALTADKWLNQLEEKWDPRRLDQNDGLDLTQEDKANNDEARENNGTIRFDPSIDNKSTLAEGIRIF